MGGCVWWVCVCGNYVVVVDSVRQGAAMIGMPHDNSNAVIAAEITDDVINDIFFSSASNLFSSQESTRRSAQVSSAQHG